MVISTLTLVSRSPSALVAHLAYLQQLYAHHTLLFALSHNTTPSSLSPLVSKLTAFSPNTLGCLSTALPQYNDHLACSLLLFSPGTAVPFRSDIPGRPAAQVGRWHAFRNKDKATAPAPAPPEEGTYTWEELWAGNTGDVTLPRGLHNLKPEDVKEVLYLSDRAPEGLINSLRAFPYTTRLGLIASSTPFVTGRPFTIFHNDRIYSSGAVGVALLRSTLSYYDPTAPRHATVATSFPGGKPLGKPMTVTSSEGNMINALDNSNPTKLLLREVEGTPHAGFLGGDDPSYFLGTLRAPTPEKGAPSETVPAQEMYTITAGDPSRGSLSLGSSRAPAVGSLVQFFHLPGGIPSYLALPPFSAHTPAHPQTPTLPQTLTLLATASHPAPALACTVASGEVHVLAGRFVGASENGFVLVHARARPPPVVKAQAPVTRKKGKGKGKTGQKDVKEVTEKEKEKEKDAAAWTCAVPGGTVDLVWGGEVVPYDT